MEDGELECSARSGGLPRIGRERAREQRADCEDGGKEKWRRAVRR
jgi:hypothetical protein